MITTPVHFNEEWNFQLSRNYLITCLESWRGFNHDFHASMPNLNSDNNNIRHSKIDEVHRNYSPKILLAGKYLYYLNFALWFVEYNDVFSDSYGFSLSFEVLESEYALMVGSWMGKRAPLWLRFPCCITFIGIASYWRVFHFLLIVVWLVGKKLTWFYDYRHRDKPSFFSHRRRRKSRDMMHAGPLISGATNLSATWLG